MSAMNTFVERYSTVTVPALKEQFTYGSEYQIPRIEKVTINVGTGDALGNAQLMKDIADLISRITGQKPVATKAHISVAGFKIRKDMVVGYKVTLRGRRMQDFLTKLSDFVLPRTRDFRGIKESSLTKEGTLNIGLRDTAIFLEGSHEMAGQGLQVTINSTAQTKEEGRVLYQTLGFLFESKDK